MFDVKNLEWTREPNRYNIKDDKIEIIIKPHTDLDGKDKFGFEENIFMKQYIVDAFTNKVFSGNPAAVCVMDKWPEEKFMMRLAEENNLSETAFIVKEEAGYHLCSLPNCRLLVKDTW